MQIVLSAMKDLTRIVELKRTAGLFMLFCDRL